MPVYRWGATWDVLHDLEREVDRLLLGAEFSFPGIRLGRQFPAVNFYETETEYILTAELPGMVAEDLELTIAAGILTLKGQREIPESISEERFRRQERFHGSWQRSISLPGQVQEEILTASFKEGVLEIHLPKVEKTEPRQIHVTDGNE
ncbi:hypothetical protein MNBD_PLANCTO02-3053 [hydrothermal vent metagenome]|uniref:SHSP domain-containing protein n=1 Tax=hydrothermal vent metagenome TaxID=652676 RepID=A0A3B1DRB2_9ZZZZ